MRMLALAQAQSTALAFVHHRRTGRLVFFTAKKDRSVSLLGTPLTVTVEETGYSHDVQQFSSDDAAAKRAIKAAFKREFPRSHRVYISSTSEKPGQEG